MCVGAGYGGEAGGGVGGVVCGLRHLNKNMEGWINYKTKNGEI